MGKIVIIEDTGVMRVKLEKVLLNKGLSEIVFVNADNNFMLNVKRIINEAPLIIIDLDLRIMEAIEVIQKIRELKSQSELSIIALSRSSGIAVLKKAISAGCSDFILKPFDDETLALKVLNLTGVAEKKQIIIKPSLSSNKEQENLTLNWTNDFSIGIKEIDEEHKEIVQNFSKLYTLMKDGKGHEYFHELIYFLNDYVHRHFDNEEIIMTKINYNKLDEQKRCHHDFKLRVEEFVKDYDGQNASNADLIKINLFIKHWLIHHILIEDRKIGEYFESIVNKKQ